MEVSLQGYLLFDSFLHKPDLQPFLWRIIALSYHKYVIDINKYQHSTGLHLKPAAFGTPLYLRAAQLHRLISLLLLFFSLIGQLPCHQ